MGWGEGKRRRSTVVTEWPHWLNEPTEYFFENKSYIVSNNCDMDAFIYTS